MNVCLRTLKPMTETWGVRRPFTTLKTSSKILKSILNPTRNKCSAAKSYLGRSYMPKKRKKYGDGLRRRWPFNWSKRVGVGTHNGAWGTPPILLISGGTLGAMDPHSPVKPSEFVSRFLHEPTGCERVLPEFKFKQMAPLLNHYWDSL